MHANIMAKKIIILTQIIIINYVTILYKKKVSIVMNCDTIIGIILKKRYLSCQLYAIVVIFK